MTPATVQAPVLTEGLMVDAYTLCQPMVATKVATRSCRKRSRTGKGQLPWNPLWDTGTSQFPQLFKNCFLGFHSTCRNSSRFPWSPLRCCGVKRNISMARSPSNTHSCASKATSAFSAPIQIYSQPDHSRLCVDITISLLTPQTISALRYVPGDFTKLQRCKHLSHCHGVG